MGRPVEADDSSGAAFAAHNEFEYRNYGPMLHLDAAGHMHLQQAGRRIARRTASAFAARTCRKDEAGAVADISIYDVLQSNGVIHSVDRVLMPK